MQQLVEQVEVKGDAAAHYHYMYPCTRRICF